MFHKLNLIALTSVLGLATTASAQTNNAFFETYGGSTFLLNVCPKGTKTGISGGTPTTGSTPWCPAEGSTVTIDLWGAGGDGGVAEFADNCGSGGTGESVCVNSGAGGGAGGYVKLTFTIPIGATQILGNITKSSASYQGETVVSYKNSSGIFQLGRAYSGANGAHATNVSGGSGMVGQTQFSGKFSVSNPGVFVAGTNGSPGLPGVTVANCVGGPGGAGGAQNNGGGAGGQGADGASCITTTPSLTLPGFGAPGGVKIGWYTPANPLYPFGDDGGSRTFSTPGGAWNVNVCRTKSQTCPGIGQPMMIEIWGAGYGGEAGKSQQRRCCGGRGGNGAQSGEYRMVYYTPPSGTTAVIGVIGKGGLGAPIGSSLLYGPPSDTTVSVTTATSGAGVNMLCSGPCSNFSAGATLGVGPQLIRQVSPGLGASGSAGLICSGGGGGYRGVLNVSPLGSPIPGPAPGQGGAGGHGGYRNVFPTCTKASDDFGLRAGESGTGGTVRVTW